MPLIKKILQPENLNAETLAEIYVRPLDITRLSEAARMFQIDQMQRILDTLVLRGVLGV